jgi:adenylate cyclase
MEENIAILIADLSGYTSLTDTHGAIAAADVIDKFLGILERSLVGTSKFHQRTGDEVLVVASSADDLHDTAVALMQNSSAEHEFLQVHGGLHYGKILKRNDDYYGNTINLTSRIAAKENPGSLWCSDEFVKALMNASIPKFCAKGKHSFKNLPFETEVFELIIDQCDTLYIDPVCRMLIRDTDQALPHPGNDEIYFCSEYCLNLHLGKDE